SFSEVGSFTRSPVGSACLGDLPRRNSVETGAVRRRKPGEGGNVADFISSFHFSRFQLLFGGGLPRVSIYGCLGLQALRRVQHFAQRPQYFMKRDHVSGPSLSF